jgi:hypothetical protein
LQFREIVLTGSTIRNGRLYFSTNDAKFFPADSYSERETTGHKGAPVKFVGAGLTFESAIRIISGLRLSPQRSFASLFRKIGALEGGLLRVTRISEREYTLAYLG